jgi:phosphatidylglycerophosphate synthase
MKDVRDITDSSVRALPKGDCYSAGERAWMEYGQELRGRLFDPGLRLLTTLRIRPDHLTVLSLLFGLSFAPLWYVEQPWLAVIALAIHVVIDGLDGPLARFQEAASPRGSFTDSFCDQLVVSTVIIMLMVGPPGLSVLGGSLFLVVYTGVLAIAMVRNSLNVPYSWLVRPRFFLFLAIPLQLLELPHSVSTVVWASNILLGIKLTTGFFKLRKRLDGPEP